MTGRRLRAGPLRQGGQRGRVSRHDEEHGVDLVAGRLVLIGRGAKGHQPATFAEQAIGLFQRRTAGERTSTRLEPVLAQPGQARVGDGPPAG
jgi:hypothetical protein